MMIDKRLIGMMGDSKRYIAKNVALQKGDYFAYLAIRHHEEELRNGSGH